MAKARWDADGSGGRYRRHVSGKTGCSSRGGVDISCCDGVGFDGRDRDARDEDRLVWHVGGVGIVGDDGGIVGGGGGAGGARGGQVGGRGDGAYVDVVGGIVAAVGVAWCFIGAW